MQNSNQKLYYWNDPEGITSNLCTIISYPYRDLSSEQLDEVLEIKGYELVNASDFYEDGNNGYEFGIHVGTYRFNGESIDIEDVEWFKTEEDRARKIMEYLPYHVNSNDICRDNPFIYPDDSVFLIKTHSGSEAEIVNSELSKVISLKEATIGSTLEIINFKASQDADPAAYIILSEIEENVQSVIVDESNANAIWFKGEFVPILRDEFEVLFCIKRPC